jgi:hypothetical protein
MAVPVAGNVAAALREAARPAIPLATATIWLVDRVASRALGQRGFPLRAWLT